MKRNINRLNEEQEPGRTTVVADSTNRQRCRLRTFLRNSGQESVTRQHFEQFSRCLGSWRAPRPSAGKEVTGPLHHRYRCATSTLPQEARDGSNGGMAGPRGELTSKTYACGFGFLFGCSPPCTGSVASLARLATLSRVISEQTSVQYIDHMNAIYPNNLFSKS